MLGFIPESSGRQLKNLPRSLMAGEGEKGRMVPKFQARRTGKKTAYM